jgi:PqqD family protein of HPr-rel-A system
VADILFSADAEAGHKIVDFDGLCALYHRRSGMTHLLAEPAPQIIMALAGKSLGLAGLLAELGLDDSAGNRAALAARLDELGEAGLVSRA